MVLDPLHYLATLDRKPGALDHAPVFRDWELPACFAAFRTALEGHHGTTAGGRRYVRVLQLLAEHPLARVCEGIEFCLKSDAISAEAVARRVQVLAAIAAPAAATTSSDEAAPPQVHVPLPDLSRFDQLLGNNHETSHYDVSTRSSSDRSPEVPVSVYFA